MFSFQKKTKSCGKCSAKYQSYEAVQAQLCPDCQKQQDAEDLERYKRQGRMQIPGYLEAILTDAGMSSAEIACDTYKIPRAIRAASAFLEASKLLAAGETPRKGFGLSGAMGGGKTGALAAVLGASVRVRLEKALEALDKAPSFFDEPRWQKAGFFRWVSWPSVSAWMKGAFSRRDGGAEIEDFVDRCIATRLLILDDLGRERVRGAYTEDFAIGQLDRIVDVRYRNNAPIIWTTNQAFEELVQLYGGAMIDRLQYLAPLVEIPNLISMRAQK